MPRSYRRRRQSPATHVDSPHVIAVQRKVIPAVAVDVDEQRFLVGAGQVVDETLAETAFPHRQHSWNLIAWSMWVDPDQSEKNIRWMREYWEAVPPIPRTGFLRQLCVRRRRCICSCRLRPKLRPVGRIEEQI